MHDRLRAGRPNLHKSTASNVNGACVEVAFADNSVLVRNSRDPLVSVLSFTYQEWAAFLKGK